MQFEFTEGIYLNCMKKLTTTTKKKLASAMGLENYLERKKNQPPYCITFS